MILSADTSERGIPIMARVTRTFLAIAVILTGVTLSTPAAASAPSTTTARSTALATIPNSPRLVVGQNVSCVIYANADIYCWGKNDQGQIGDGTTVDRTTPVQISPPPNTRFTTIAPGDVHSCAITDAGVPYCWGDNTYAALGDGTLKRPRFCAAPMRVAALG